MTEMPDRSHADILEEIQRLVRVAALPFDTSRTLAANAAVAYRHAADLEDALDRLAKMKDIEP
jgi:hypothetical protein